MLCVETIGKIRRARFRDGRSIKGISRDFRLSRETVRKVLRSGATEFVHERRTQPRPKIGPWESRLEGMLDGNASRSERERVSLTRIFEDLQALGYAGGYDAVRRHASRWSKDREASSPAKAHIPLSFDPGEAYQFDWSHEDAVIGGKLVRLKVAHVRLCHSRMSYVRAYHRESQEMLFDAHEKAFAFFGGACARGIYDNMRTALKRGHEPQRILGDLLEAEISEKRSRSIKYQMTIAKLPLAKELEEFDFGAAEVDEALVRSLAAGDALDRQRNAVLVGGTGTGKTHLAVGLARAWIRDGRRGRDGWPTRYRAWTS